MSPTLEQTSFQVATRKFILLEGNAGAAKTTTLALRVAESLVRGVTPDRFLILTATEAAVEVFRARLGELGIPHGIANRLHISTFESYAKSILRKVEKVDIRSYTTLEELRPIALQALEEARLRYACRYSLDVSDNKLAIDAFLKSQARLKATFAIPRLQIDFAEQTPDEIEGLLKVPLLDFLWHRAYEKLRGAADGMVEFRAPNDATFDLLTLLESEPWHRRRYLPAPTSCVTNSMI